MTKAYFHVLDNINLENNMKRKTFTVLLILLGLIFLVALAVLAFYHQQGSANLAFTDVSPVHAMRVDYLEVDSSRAEVAVMETRMQQAGVNLVAISAGRADWAYFRWNGHSDRWADIVQTSGQDILLEDSKRFGKWAHVSAVVDVLSPRYIQQHPEAASVSWQGVPATDMVSTMELVDGQFGQQVLDMIGQIAAYYPVNSITITELVYYVDGYGTQDKTAYLAYTGRSDWPRLANGQIDIDAPSIGEWRSYEIGRFLEKAAAIAHQHGKQLFVEVRIGVDSSGHVFVRNGTDINLFLKYADRLVVRGSNDPASRSQSSMNAIAKYMTTYRKNGLILTLGLWDKDYDSGTPGNQMSSISVADFQAILQGDATNLWITPSFLMSDAHWQILDKIWGNQPKK